MAEARPDGRREGSIEQRGGSLRVVVFAGYDPVTGRRAYKRATINGTDDAAWRKARNKRTELRADVLRQRRASSSVKFDHCIDEWFSKSDLEDSTRNSYGGYIKRVIKPTLGHVAVNRLDANDLESLYAELRRCRTRCDGKPFIEKHRVDGGHDCVMAKCEHHECDPMAPSTVRQIHSIISSALDAAMRWGWIDTNPAKIAKRPKQEPPQPKPPSAADAARIVDKAFDLSPDWGTLVWLVMTTGMRRAEVAGLRWFNVKLDEEVIEIRNSYVEINGSGKVKSTKTHQMRRVALDSETVALLRAHKNWSEAELAKVDVDLEEHMFVFMGDRKYDPETRKYGAPKDPTQPYSPDAISRRYKRMAGKLGIETHIHALRHFSATELLTAGVDLRTVAGRLGHGGGGATTLRVYAAWVAASDRKAAEILGSRLPKRSRSGDS
ncbi:MAG TPA: site-specific integrase [Actinophytocola sp.]|jgi:integrase|nr:site-specific integrase [Actinophytocola sp.]